MIVNNMWDPRGILLGLMGITWTTTRCTGLKMETTWTIITV
jgi:hypothetical protein